MFHYVNSADKRMIHPVVVNGSSACPRRLRSDPNSDLASYHAELESYVKRINLERGVGTALYL